MKTTGDTWFQKMEAHETLRELNYRASDRLSDNEDRDSELGEEFN